MTEGTTFRGTAGREHGRALWATASLDFAPNGCKDQIQVFGRSLWLCVGKGFKEEREERDRPGEDCCIVRGRMITGAQTSMAVVGRGTQIHLGSRINRTWLLADLINNFFLIADHYFST